MSIACADMSDVDLSEAYVKTFNQSAKVVYRCEVQTIIADGSAWRYQTDEIMNLMEDVKLTVSHDYETYGPFSLPKIDTDTFSDGNLTIKLVQLGAKKSISVDHSNMSLFARAENGWCSSMETDRYEDQPADHWGDADQNRQDNLPGERRLDVPYFYQYSNQIQPRTTCQNTSVAMVLNYYGAQVSPDQITQEFGNQEAMGLQGLNNLYNRLASRYGLRGIDSYPRGTLAQIKSAIDSGKPVITHGFFTAGHLVVIVGYNDSGYFVNDPAGVWNLRYSGRYPNAGYEPNAGDTIFYPKRAFELAIMSFDGRTLDSAYLHIPR